MRRGVAEGGLYQRRLDDHSAVRALQVTCDGLCGRL